MAKFDFKCPQCGESIEADDSFRGQVAECPSCGKGIVVPRTAAAPSPKSRLHPIQPPPPPPKTGKNVTLHSANAPKRNGAATGPAVPESVGGAQHRNVEYIRDAFSREVKTIKGTANVLLFREIILFACIALVIAGTVGGIWYSYHKRNQAEQLAWQREQERRKLEEEEQARREEARRKEQEEARLARERERKRLEAERLAEEEARKAAERRRKMYDALANDYREAPLDYLRNAPKAVLPGSVRSKTAYSCMMADDVDGVAFFRIVVTPGEPMIVQRLSADAAPTNVPTSVFNERCKTESYLMVANGRPYLSPKKRTVRSYPIPRSDATLNPALEELGSDIYRIVKDMGIRTNLMRYDVYLQPKDGSAPLSVGQVGFGDELSIDRFRTPIREKLEEQARERAEAYSRDKAARAKIGGTRGGQSTSRPSSLELQLAKARSSTQNSYSRNRTVYTGGNIIYRSETERTGPTQYQREKIASLEARLAAENEATARRQAAAARRQAEADALFAQGNTVTDRDVDEMLNRYNVTFRPAK